eukprot:scaffold110728_cov48-Prasinocladus_malaysianus.AAC.3
MPCRRGRCLVEICSIVSAGSDQAQSPLSVPFDRSLNFDLCMSVTYHISLLHHAFATYCLPFSELSIAWIERHHQRKTELVIKELLVVSMWVARTIPVNGLKLGRPGKTQNFAAQLNASWELIHFYVGGLEPAYSICLFVSQTRLSHCHIDKR